MNFLPRIFSLKSISLILFVFISSVVYSQTTYYVNDNSLTGDTYTSAVGNDGNAGTAAAPFATIAKAIAVAVASDIIYVDAGNYTVAQTLVNKSLTIFYGANYDKSAATPADRALIGDESIINGGIQIGSSGFTAYNSVLKGSKFIASGVAFTGPAVADQAFQFFYTSIYVTRNRFSQTGGTGEVAMEADNTEGAIHSPS